MTILSLTTGTAFIMWLGEQITERGIGNGMSLIIFTGIVVGVPDAIGNLYTNVFVTHEWSVLDAGADPGHDGRGGGDSSCWWKRRERRIPVQYAKRVIGRRVMGGQSTHMPLKVNAGGVIPVIFASSILAFPQTIATFPFVKNNAWLSEYADVDPARRAALRRLVRGADHLLLLLLRFDHLQSERSGGQHAQVRRIHPGHPSGPQHFGLHEHDPDPDHVRGRHLPVDSLPDPGDHDLRASICSICR